jgi:hypothetical protein
LVYLPIVFILQLNKNLLFKLFLFEAIIAGIFIGLNKNILEALTSSIFQYLANYDSRFAIYSTINTRYGYLLYWGMQLYSFVMMSWSKNIVSANRMVTDNIKKVVDLVYTINAYMLLFLPFYVFEITYYRYARNILILNYVVNSITCYSINNTYKKVIYVFFVILLVLIHFYFDLYNPHSANIIDPLFKYNWILTMN